MNWEIAVGWRNIYVNYYRNYSCCLELCHSRLPMKLLWFTCSWQLSTRQPFVHPPHSPSGVGERTGRVKVRKLVGWETSINKAKAAHASKAKQGIHSLLPISRQVFSHLQESRAVSCATITWEDKCHHSKCDPFLSSSPCFICWAWHPMAWNIPWVCWDQLSQLCPLPASPASPAYSLVGQCEEQKRPWLCVSAA